MPIRPEIFKKFRRSRSLYPWKVGEYLEPPSQAEEIDSDLVSAWERGETAIPDWVAARVFQKEFQQEKYLASMLRVLHEDAQKVLPIILYELIKDFPEFQPWESQVFPSATSYLDFQEKWRSFWSELGISHRVAYVPMHRPDYELWLEQTNQVHSRETLFDWAHQEYEKHGSRLEHPAWEKMTRAEILKSMAAQFKPDYMKRDKSEKEPYDPVKHTERMEDLKAAVKKRLYGEDDKEDQVEYRPDGTVYLKKRAQGFQFRFLTNESLKRLKERLQQIKAKKVRRRD